MSWLDALPGIRDVVNSIGATLPRRKTLRAGAGIELTDIPASAVTEVTATGGAGLSAPVSPADNGKIARASGGDLTYYAGVNPGNVLQWDGFGQWSAGPVVLSDADAVTGYLALANLAPGGAGTVLADLGAGNVWTGAPIVTSITAGASVATGATLTATALQWGASVVAPIIGMVAAGDAVGQDITIRAQGNNSATLRAGNLVIGGGVNAGAGANGTVQVLTGLELASYLSVTGATTIGNAQWLRWDSAPSGTPVNALAVNAAEVLLVGSSGANGPTSASYDVQTGGVHQLRVNDVVAAEFAATYTSLNIADGLLVNSATPLLRLGQAPGSGAGSAAATGTIRLHKAFSIYVRNNADSADLGVLSFSAAANQLQFGENSLVRFDCNTSFSIYVGAAQKVLVDANTMFLADAGTPPSSNPVGGGLFYASGGELFWRSSAGVATQLTP